MYQKIVVYNSDRIEEDRKQMSLIFSAI